MQASLDSKKMNTTSFGISICLHVILLLCLIITMQSQFERPALKSGPQIIQATAILQLPPSPAPPAVSKPAPPVAEPKKTAPLKEKNAKPVQDVVTIEDKKAAAEIALKKRQEAKKAAELKRQERLKQQQLVAQKKRKLAEQKLLQQQQEDLLQQQLSQEQQQLTAAKNDELQGVVDKYKALIVNAIGSNWYSTNNHLFCKVSFRLAPDGTVTNVKLVKSSGDAAFDQAAIQAVNKSSPLPVPDDAQALQIIRDINVQIGPRGVSGDNKA